MIEFKNNEIKLYSILVLFTLIILKLNKKQIYLKFKVLQITAFVNFRISN